MSGFKLCALPREKSAIYHPSICLISSSSFLFSLRISSHFSFSPHFTVYIPLSLASIRRELAAEWSRANTGADDWLRYVQRNDTK